MPFLIGIGLLVPGGYWDVQEVRPFAGLIMVLILLGFVLAMLKHFTSSAL